MGTGICTSCSATSAAVAASRARTIADRTRRNNESSSLRSKLVVAAVAGLLSLTAAIGALAAHSDLPGQSEGNASEINPAASSTPAVPAANADASTPTASLPTDGEAPYTAPAGPPLDEQPDQIENTTAPVEPTSIEGDGDGASSGDCLKHDTPAHGDTGGNHCGAQTGSRLTPELTNGRHAPE